MSYLGVGYSGPEDTFLKDVVDEHKNWLSGDRLPRFYGNRFLVMYDSNTAREFIKKISKAAEGKKITVYPMARPSEGCFFS